MLTTGDRLTDTRASYDTVADSYARLLRDALAGDPWDRAVLGLFAELVTAGGAGPVADVGCGPGRITAHLRALGLAAVGLDLSSGMVAAGRPEHPGLPVAVGSMTALPVATSSPTGLVAWYLVAWYLGGPRARRRPARGAGRVRPGPPARRRAAVEGRLLRRQAGTPSPAGFLLARRSAQAQPSMACRSSSASARTFSITGTTSSSRTVPHDSCSTGTGS